LTGAGDGDALKIDVAVQVAEVAQDREGLHRAFLADPTSVGVERREHRAMLRLFGAADAMLKVHRALDRHDGGDIGERGRRSVSVGGSMDGGGISEGSRFANAIARRGASVYTPPTLERGASLETSGDGRLAQR
jgi:hypothetical protein